MSLAAAGAVEPKLEHSSSKKFFGKDYPVDDRPVADKHLHFGHPYPALQDGKDFDRDYVADQNEDNGQWANQMQYDILRQKVRQAEKELEALKRKMEQEEAEMKQVERFWKTEVAEVTKASVKVVAADSVEHAAENKVNGAKDDVNGGAANVEKEMEDLEKCKGAC